jgi:Mg/Co/Ni transporter MgtE
MPASPTGSAPPPATRLSHRATLLVGLLVFQSCSSFILSSFGELLQRHTVIVFFLTMLVGAGGNAGNQASVLVIRGLATGDISARQPLAYIWSETKVAFCMACIMVTAGFLRVIAFQENLQDAVAIAACLFVIVFISIIAGAILPICLHRMRLDPAHAGATIQVVMDLLGVLITCCVCSLLLPGPGSGHEWTKKAHHHGHGHEHLHVEA